MKTHGSRAAFEHWKNFAERPITPAPEHETNTEATARLYKDMLTRTRLFDAARLRIAGPLSLKEKVS